MNRLRPTPHRVWIAAFAVWVFLLTGAWTTFSDLPFWAKRDNLSKSAPGLIQLWSLTRHLDERNEKVAQTQREMAALQAEIDALEHNPVAQEREVRRTLNYLREDELVFEIREALPASSPNASPNTTTPARIAGSGRGPIPPQSTQVNGRSRTL